MFEKVNPAHPDKVADRIAGALVDYAYTQNDNPRIAVEVLIGHGECNVVAETSEHIPADFVCNVVDRISKQTIRTKYVEVPQNEFLAENQKERIKCGDNGIFRGVPTTEEQKELSSYARKLYQQIPYDGKYVLDKDAKKLIVCQSHLDGKSATQLVSVYDRYSDFDVRINPLGYWTGGVNVDTGATNRKLGSDMGDAVTGGGLHGKDLSKADVSVNIYAHLTANNNNQVTELCCAIGDETVDGIPFSHMVQVARAYIKSIGGFEKFAEWGLI